jgi:hypothetical protein
VSAERRNRHGRPDLWFRLGDVSVIAEAKLHWILGRQLLRSQTIATKLEGALAEAAADAQGCLEGRGAMRLAVVFTGCWFPINQAGRADEYRHNAVAGIEAVAGDAHAWVFPDSGFQHPMRQPRWSPDLQYYHYGSALIGRVVA